jgi:thioredoxin-dependent peroxiredoxin
MPKALKKGEKAPALSLETKDGPIGLKDFKGEYLVLYFYPKDDTPGCTTEAVDFSALASKFTKAGAQIVGVSKDSLETHDKFSKKHKLKVILATDPDGETLEAYGAWGEKSMYGKKFEGIIRSTVLIDPAGRIAEHWPKVSVKGHAEAVLKALQELVS